MTDPTLRRALARIDRSYIEPRRIDPPRMLESALRSAGLGNRDPAAQVPLVGSLVERLAPGLERALETAGCEGPAPGTGAGPVRHSWARARAALLGGALRALDPYSRAVTGQGRQVLVDRLAGTVCGIGVRLGRRDGRLRILRCYPGSAAAEAGLRPGDVLIAIDGEPVDDLPVAGALNGLRGASGTPVRVGIEGEGSGEFTLVRKPFAVPSVKSHRIDDGIVWMRLARLSKSTPGQFDREVKALGRTAAIAGWILDLRGNRGGSMLAAGEVADRFVGRGTLLEALDRSDRSVPGLRQRVDARDETVSDSPVAVIIDAATSSSAELLAAALAWNDRGLLVGGRSFGKNSVMKLYHFEQADLTLRLCVAYMKAAGRRLPEGGLEPDVGVDGRLPRTATPEAAGAADPFVSIAASLIRGCGSRSRRAWLRKLRTGGAPGGLGPSG